MKWENEKIFSSDFLRKRSVSDEYEKIINEGKETRVGNISSEEADKGRKIPMWMS